MTDLDADTAAAGAIARLVHRIGGNAPVFIRNNIGPRYRPRFVSGATLAVRLKWIKLESGRLMPGEKSPPRVSRSDIGDLAAQIEARMEEMKARP